MNILHDILKGVHILQRAGNSDSNISIKHLHASSTAVEKNSIFFAIKGTTADGHHYISDAIKRGASVIVCEDLPEEINSKIVYLKVKSSSESMGRIACNFYDNPSSKMQVVGVTGTNGKTTTATLLYQLFRSANYKVGLLSTIQYCINDTVLPSTHTTPDNIQLNQLLSKMYQQGCTHVFMECSSHAIEQNRIAGVHFKGGIFTNLTHDHLDYHGSFSKYRDAKKKFFDALPSSAFAIINADDKNGLYMIQNTQADSYSYGMYSESDYMARIFGQSLQEGMDIEINQKRFHTPLVGSYNVENLLAVFAAAERLGMPPEQIVVHLSGAVGANGRLDKVMHKTKKIIGIVDYAHTPDAVQHLLQTIRQIKKNNETITTIIGCGGDRDPSKRNAMGKIACMLSNHVIFTSDNPRSEDPKKICEQMSETLTDEEFNKVITILDRKEAIDHAVKTAQNNTIIILAGKGHENYQIINNVKKDFDDKVELINAFHKYA